MQQQKIKTNNI